MKRDDAFWMNKNSWCLCDGGLRFRPQYIPWNPAHFRACLLPSTYDSWFERFFWCHGVIYAWEVRSGVKIKPMRITTRSARHNQLIPTQLCKSHWYASRSKQRYRDQSHLPLLHNEKFRCTNEGRSVSGYMTWTAKSAWKGYRIIFQIDPQVLTIDAFRLLVR